MRRINRGDVFYCDLSGTVGSEQAGIRPVVIVQNNVGNKFSPTTLIAPITSQKKACIPTHCSLNTRFLKKTATVMCEQVRTISKERLKEKIGTLEQDEMAKIDESLKISLGL